MNVLNDLFSNLFPVIVFVFTVFAWQSLFTEQWRHSLSLWFLRHRSVSVLCRLALPALVKSPHLDVRATVAGHKNVRPRTLITLLLHGEYEVRRAAASNPRLVAALAHKWLITLNERENHMHPAAPGHSRRGTPVKLSLVTANNYLNSMKDSSADHYAWHAIISGEAPSDIEAVTQAAISELTGWSIQTVTTDLDKIELLLGRVISDSTVHQRLIANHAVQQSTLLDSLTNTWHENAWLWNTCNATTHSSQCSASPQQPALTIDVKNELLRLKEEYLHIN